jgi:hypothetical protein
MHLAKAFTASLHNAGDTMARLMRRNSPTSAGRRRVGPGSVSLAMARTAGETPQPSRAPRVGGANPHPGGVARERETLTFLIRHRASASAFGPGPAGAGCPVQGEGSSRAGSAVLHCDAWVVISGTHRASTTQYHAAFRVPPESTGRARIRRPTALKIALQIAADTGGTPGSPTPPGGASLHTP